MKSTCHSQLIDLLIQQGLEFRMLGQVEKPAPSNNLT